MGTTGGGIQVAPEQSAEKRRVNVVISELAFQALTGDGAGLEPSSRMEHALRCYLGDGGSGKPAWPYPGFLRASETQEDVEVELELASDLWQDFVGEADRQGVTVEQMAEH